jgi:redox-sensitive bicupin YhaK (pirin superfamily)
MTAGSGIRHSEFNPSATEPVHLYQIWLLPESRNLTPEYEQKPFPEEGRRGRWQQVASKDGADGSLRIHQDARLFLANLAPGQSLSYTLAEGRSAWLQTLRGEVALNGTRLLAGDGAALTDEASLTVSAEHPAEVLLFDLA